jgi:16S rRNA (cytosine967-C5)-methyltransferase
MSTDSEPAAEREPPETTARGLAARVVYRVLTQQAFVSETLDRELVRSELDERDRALATELSYGVIRLERALQSRLDALSKRGTATTDPLARAHLLVAAYQLLALDRVPAFAAINEAVESLRRLRGPKVAGFGNAILRKLSQEPKLSLPGALESAVPPWLWTELCNSVGREGALGLLGATGASARRGLCVRLRRFGEAARTPDPTPEELPWLATAEPGKLAPGAFWLPPSGDLRRLAGFAEGSFVVQEEGAQWCAWALGVLPGERVLDACAGHGQKAAMLAEQVGPSGSLWVNDVAPRKLERLVQEFRRLGLPAPHCRSVDLSEGIGDLPGDLQADMARVLVDAPCTGTGTLRRRPEIANRLSEGDPRRLGEQSVKLLCNAARLVPPGGRVSFVVCSVLRAECEDVVERVLHVLEPLPFEAPAAQRVAGEGQWQCRLLPQIHGTDAYFVASFRRRP